MILIEFQQPFIPHFTEFHRQSTPFNKQIISHLLSRKRNIELETVMLPKKLPPTAAELYVLLTAAAARQQAQMLLRACAMQALRLSAAAAAK